MVQMRKVPNIRWNKQISSCMDSSEQGRFAMKDIRAVEIMKVQIRMGRRGAQEGRGSERVDAYGQSGDWSYDRSYDYDKIRYQEDKRKEKYI